MSSPSRPYVVAEIGSGHGGDLPRAIQLIDAAQQAGADCAKFQIIIADELIHPDTGSVMLPGGAVPLYKHFRALERPIDFYATLRRHCATRGIDFLASVFGIRSLNMLTQLGERRVKIASPELNHLPLLRAVTARKMEAILSTGVATLADIARALEITGREGITLLHCITAYPAPAEEYNLKLLRTLSAVFGVPTGLSDHSDTPEPVPALATALGATLIEKHITLSRTNRQPDDPIALEPWQFAEMVHAIRRVAALRQQAPSNAMGQLERRHGTALCARITGDGVKRLAPSERGNYGYTNRSLLARRNIAIGEPLDETNCALLRSEKNLRPGLSPATWEILSDACARRPIRSGQGIVWQDIEPPRLLP